MAVLPLLAGALLGGPCSGSRVCGDVPPLLAGALPGTLRGGSRVVVLQPVAVLEGKAKAWTVAFADVASLPGGVPSAPCSHPPCSENSTPGAWGVFFTFAWVTRRPSSIYAWRCFRLEELLQVSCAVVPGTGVSASVVMRCVPPLGTFAPSVLSLLTGARKSYAGSVEPGCAVGCSC